MENREEGPRASSRSAGRWLPVFMQRPWRVWSCVLSPNSRISTGHACCDPISALCNCRGHRLMQVDESSRGLVGCTLTSSLMRSMGNFAKAIATWCSRPLRLRGVHTSGTCIFGSALSRRWTRCSAFIVWYMVQLFACVKSYLPLCVTSYIPSCMCIRVCLFSAQVVVIPRMCTDFSCCITLHLSTVRYGDACPYFADGNCSIQDSRVG